MDRNAGYVADVDYTYGYYRVLQSEFLKLACINAGVTPPAGDRLSYLELGFGKGLTINIHAAANPGTFWGTDLNANYAAEAVTVAAASGSGVRLLAESFIELAARPDLPEFDVIVMHGVWSWLSAESRRQVIDLIRRRLRVGGLFYVSYNSYPGSAALDPLNELLALHADHAQGAATGTLDKLERALGFAQEMAGADSLYFREHPYAGRALASLKERNRNQLAHEALSRGRKSLTFASVSQELAAASLSFVASARLLDHFDGINLTAAGQKLLAGIAHPVFRQMAFDYLVNQQARFDIFVRGLRPLPAIERSEALHAMSFVSLGDFLDRPLVARPARGEVALDEAVCRPRREGLAENRHEPKPLRRIAQHPRLQGIARPKLVEALLVLLAVGHLAIAREPTAETRARCKALNRYLWNRARNDGDIGWLASPVTGGGVAATRFEQLFLAAVSTGKKAPAEQAGLVWQILSAQGHRLMHDGKTLQSPEENIAHLTTMATEFNDRRLGLLRTLELV